MPTNSRCKTRSGHTRRRDLSCQHIRQQVERERERERERPIPIAGSALLRTRLGGSVMLLIEEEMLRWGQGSR